MFQDIANTHLIFSLMIETFIGFLSGDLICFCNMSLTHTEFTKQCMEIKYGWRRGQKNLDIQDASQSMVEHYNE